MVKKIKSRRLSAVSSIMQSISNDNSVVPSEQKFHFVIADNLFHRFNAFRLGYNEYLKKGFVNENDYKAILSPLDWDPDTLTVVAYHGEREVGTVTINTQSKLPFSELFDTAAVCPENFKGAELTRLAVDEEYRNQRDILLGMFNVAFAYSKFIRKCTHFVIEVNPRHVKFYERILGFVPVAENASCPRVKGAPAVLLFGDLELPALFPENYPFLSVKEELQQLIAQISEARPLTNKEKEVLINTYQGIQNSVKERSLVTA